jgi:hypothetical protein
MSLSVNVKRTSTRPRQTAVARVQTGVVAAQTHNPAEAGPNE